MYVCLSTGQRITTIQLDGVQYFVSRMNPYSPELNYFLAYQYCRSLGLQLVSFETKEKADSITQYLKNAGMSVVLAQVHTINDPCNIVVGCKVKVDVDDVSLCLRRLQQVRLLDIRKQARHQHVTVDEYRTAIQRHLQLHESSRQ